MLAFVDFLLLVNLFLQLLQLFKTGGDVSVKLDNILLELGDLVLLVIKGLIDLLDGDLDFLFKIDKLLCVFLFIFNFLILEILLELGDFVLSPGDLGLLLFDGLLNSLDLFLMLSLRIVRIVYKGEQFLVEILSLPLKFGHSLQWTLRLDLVLPLDDGEFLVSLILHYLKISLQL